MADAAAAAQAAEDAREAQANLMVRNDLSKLPMWFGIPSKDTLKARQMAPKNNRLRNGGKPLFVPPIKKLSQAIYNKGRGYSPWIQFWTIKMNVFVLYTLVLNKPVNPEPCYSFIQHW